MSLATRGTMWRGSSFGGISSTSRYALKLFALTTSDGLSLVTSCVEAAQAASRAATDSAATERIDMAEPAKRRRKRS